MSRVLVAWEDEHYRGLERVVRRRLAARGGATPPVVLHHTARGNGVFQRYVQSTWTRARAAGLPNNPGPIDHLICVVDGDKLCERHPQVARAPAASEEVAAWHAAASAAWEELVRSWVDPSVPATTVHGIVLRWSRESVVLASFDQPPFHTRLGVEAACPAVQNFLAKDCAPSPGAVKGGRFTDIYQKPMKCLERMFRAAEVALLAKNDPAIDDVLSDIARDNLDPVCDRVPDIDAIVTRALDPAAAPTTGPASSTKAPTARRPRKPRT